MSSLLTVLFANRIQSIRENLGLSQEDFAEVCDVDRTYIGRLERLERTPKLDTLEKIANGLGVKVHDLINFDKELEVNLKKPH